jgi:hypothetical protein
MIVTVDTKRSAATGRLRFRDPLAVFMFEKYARNPSPGFARILAHAGVAAGGGLRAPHKEI